MAWRLPSLSALRAFEAAARLSSFTKAAAELHVTQAAVSHQVRALEDQLGVRLFERTTRRLALTPAGRRLFPAASEAFEGLARAVAGIGRGEQLLAITTTPSFGANWLAPRLGRFAERHPAIELSIRHAKAVLDLGQEGLDLAIRWGKGGWPGVEAELIGPSALAVVGAPAYVKRLKLKAPADVARATLLHDETHEEWSEWLIVAGLDPGLAKRGVVFDDENAMIQAVIGGQGLALEPRSVAAGLIAEGRLVTPFDLSLAEGYGFYLVYEREALKLPKVAAFRQFLLEEAARGQAAAPRTIPPAASRKR
ncbi:MAG TPA: transcriptional regulator GcvA [Candidatus Udaeobacter sp.]|nr:transcriptional regulator GcvA [Candidatus Udaeobacter sp.]